LPVKTEENPHRHVPALDGVRGCAAAIVFVYHYGGGAQSHFLPLRVAGTLLRFGWAGVSLFFVLSGFLISGILWDGFKRPNWWKRFYLRRSLRIFPLYYLAIVIAVVAWLIMGYSAGQISPVLYYVFYLGDIPALGKYFTQIPRNIPLIHFWSLAVEEQFYIFWPFLLVLFAGRRKGAKQLILALWLLSLVFRIAVLAIHAPQEWSGEFLLGRAGELLTGAYLALMVRGDADEQQRLFRLLPAIFWGSLLAIAGIGFASGGLSFDSPLMSTAGLCACSIGFAAVIGSALRPGIAQSAFANPVLRWLGKISYGIYVYHLLLRGVFLWAAYRLAPGLGYEAHLALLFGIALAGTLAAASLSFYTIEAAFLRWKDRIAG
jgi:peptidoglycan/LPS O-acetylase OafA/YrhL